MQKIKRIRNHKAIKEAQQIRCQLCGSFALQKEVHHIIPRSLLGDDIPMNLICLCRSCHSAAHEGRLSREILWRYKGIFDGEWREYCRSKQVKEDV